MKRSPIVIAWVAAFTLSAVVAGCVVSRSPITGNKRAYGYTWQQEVAMGTEADGQITAQYGLYDDAVLSKYVDSLGQALLQVSHLQRPAAEAEWKATKFHFRILDSPVINAFALPGGFVYVTRGLMAHLENEAQLAVVLGHEIGHVAGRHASKRAVTQMGGNLLLIGAAVGGQLLIGGKAAEDILNLGGTATQLLFLSYGRDDERESDRLGVEYASMIGYEASQAAAFFHTLKRLGDQSGGNIPSFMSTHPDPGERESTVQRLAAERATEYQTDRVARNYYLGHVDGVVFGDNPRHGFVRNARFYHPDMAFQFPVPESFDLINQASQVALVAKDKGAVLVLKIDSEHATAEAAAEAFKNQEGVTSVEAGIGMANGLSARYVVADVTSSDGQELRLRAHFIDYRSTVYSFLAMALKEGFSEYDGRFQQVMKGFSRLTDPAMLNVQPDRINLVSTRGNTRFESVLPSRLPEGITPSALAILNQLDLGDMVEKGHMLKLVE